MGSMLYHRQRTECSRVRLPNGMNSLFASKLLVSTGPKFKDAGCTENVDVEVNLCPPGNTPILNICAK